MIWKLNYFSVLVNEIQNKNLQYFQEKLKNQIEESKKYWKWQLKFEKTKQKLGKYCKKNLKNEKKNSK